MAEKTRLVVSLPHQVTSIYSNNSKNKKTAG